MNTITMNTVKIFPPDVDDDKCCNHDRPTATEADASASAASNQYSPNSKHQKQHQQHEESDDTTTTAYSSWIQDSCYSNSPFSSSCFTFHSSRDELVDVDEVDGYDDDDDEHPPRLLCSRRSSSSSLFGSALTSEEEDEDGGNDDANNVRRRQMSRNNSSYYSAVTTHHSNDTDAWDEFYFELHPFVVVAHHQHHQVESRVESSSSSHDCNKDKNYDYTRSSASLAENDDYVELIQRADRMLERESDQQIEDHFHHAGDDPWMPLPTSNDDHCDDVDDEDDTSYSPIDSICRSKMMEWSFRVVEYSFPHHPSSSSQGCDSPQHSSSSSSSSSSRKYSIETLQIVSQTFNLVDRLSTLHFLQNSEHHHSQAAMDRREYKLICMACLHITAKTCGLFGVYGELVPEVGYPPLHCCNNEDGLSSEEEEEVAEEEVVISLSNWQQGEEENNHASHHCHCGRHDSAFDPSLSSSGSAMHSSQCEGRSISSTPVLSCNDDDDDDDTLYRNQLHSGNPPRNISIDNDNNNDEGVVAIGAMGPTRPANKTDYYGAHLLHAENNNAKPILRNTRPPLDLLSLSGLSTLCHDEYSTERLINAEQTVLERLHWKVTSVTCLDWWHVLLDLLSLVVLREDVTNTNNNNNDVVGDHHRGHGNCSSENNGRIRQLRDYYKQRKRRNAVTAFHMDGIKERSLVHIERAMGMNRILPSSLVAWAAVSHSLDECDTYCGYEMRRVIGVYRGMIRDTMLSLYGEDEVDGV